MAIAKHVLATAAPHTMNDTQKDGTSMPLCLVGPRFPPGSELVANLVLDTNCHTHTCRSVQTNERDFGGHANLVASVPFGGVWSVPDSV